MNEHNDPESLGTGALGRLAVLAGEIRGLRAEVAVLLHESGRINAAGERIVEQQRVIANVLNELRGGQDDMTNLLANAIEGLHAVHSIVGYIAAQFQQSVETEFEPVPDAAIEPEPPVGNGRSTELETSTGPDPAPSTKTLSEEIAKED